MTTSISSRSFLAGIYATRNMHTNLLGKQVPRGVVEAWADRAKAQSWKWPDTYSSQTVHDMQCLLNEIVPSTALNRNSLYDCHFAFNTSANESLGSDGYDNYQAPLGPYGQELFSRRMWVNGSIEYFGKGPTLDQRIDCVETIPSVRYLSNNVFVKIARIFKDGSTQSPVMKETRSVMYTNLPYRGENDTRGSAVKAQGQSCVTAVSLEQQVRFSSLTANLHRIHYDLDHCYSENFRQVVVSGPFLVSIMLHHYVNCYPHSFIKKLTYRNSEPCFVDDRLEIVNSDTAEGHKISIRRQDRVLCEGTFITM